jgi:hypothetical protein
MDASVVLSRAFSGMGKKTVYKSPGKMPPFAAVSWPAAAQNDCSGFVSWCLRFSQSRKVDHPLYRRVNGGWFETTAIYQDGIESTGYFHRIDDARPGALLVYPDYGDTAGDRHDGHVGIVVEAPGTGIKGVTKVIHCSLGNFKRNHDAIDVTDASPWLSRKESIIVWLEGLTE